MTSPHMHQHSRGVHLKPTHDSSQNHAIPKLIGYLVSLSNQKVMSLLDECPGGVIYNHRRLRAYRGRDKLLESIRYLRSTETTSSSIETI